MICLIVRIVLMAAVWRCGLVVEGGPGSSGAVGPISIFSSNYFRSTSSNKNMFIHNSNNNNKLLNYNGNSYKQYLLARPNYTTSRLSCPGECSCKGLSIDCSGRHLTLVPDNISKDLIRAYTDGLFVFVFAEYLNYSFCLK